MSRPEILVTSALVTATSTELVAPLQRLGASLKFSPFKSRRAPGELPALLAGARAMIAGTDPLTADILDAAPNLVLIARVGVGYDAIDLTAARRRGITVTVTPGANEATVADYTLAAILALLRGVAQHHANMRAGRWDRQPGRDLTGKTVGIIGLGRIGKLVARRLSGFDVRLLAHDPWPDPLFANQYAVTYLPLEALLAEADVVTVHVLLDAGTYHLLDAKRIGLMRRTAVLINTCRGPVVDEAALAAALSDGRLAGAALDVFEEEPPVGRPILDAPHVLLSPHIAGVTAESAHRMAAMAVVEVVRLLEGQPPLHPVAPPPAAAEEATALS